VHKYTAPIAHAGICPCTHCAITIVVHAQFGSLHALSRPYHRLGERTQRLQIWIGLCPVIVWFKDALQVHTLDLSANDLASTKNEHLAKFVASFPVVANFNLSKTRLTLMANGVDRLAIQLTSVFCLHTSTHDQQSLRLSTIAHVVARRQPIYRSMHHKRCICMWNKRAVHRASSGFVEHGSTDAAVCRWTGACSNRRAHSVGSRPVVVTRVFVTERLYTVTPCGRCRTHGSPVEHVPTAQTTQFAGSFIQLRVPHNVLRVSTCVGQLRRVY
jgi:hypothetical protein